MNRFTCRQTGKQWTMPQCKSGSYTGNQIERAQRGASIQSVCSPLSPLPQLQTTTLHVHNANTDCCTPDIECMTPCNSPLPFPSSSPLPFPSSSPLPPRHAPVHRTVGSINHYQATLCCGLSQIRTYSDSVTDTGRS